MLCSIFTRCKLQTNARAAEAMHRSWLSAMVLAGALTMMLLGPSWADVVGEARVIDGDTIEVAGERIRLHGIDAPEARQTCVIAGQRWRCGESATLALEHEVEGHSVTCRGKKRDRYGRIIAVCYAGENDLNALMVRDGWALAYRRYAKDYVTEETEAQNAFRGMWRGQFVPPWKWRRNIRLIAQE